MTTDNEGIKGEGHYEAQGYVRYMIITRPEYRDQLKTLAKKLGLRQGDVVEALIDTMNEELVAARAKEMNQAAAGSKVSKRAVLQQMKNLTPEQLKAIQNIITSGAEAA